MSEKHLNIFEILKSPNGRSYQRGNFKRFKQTCRTEVSRRMENVHMLFYRNFIWMFTLSVSQIMLSYFTCKSLSVVVFSVVNTFFFFCFNISSKDLMPY